MAGWKEVIFKGITVADLGMIGAAEGDMLVAGSGAFTFAVLTKGVSGKFLKAGASTVSWEDASIAKLEDIAKRDDDTEYVIKVVYSTEIDILNAANAGDWDYLQVSGITPIIASKVRIKCYVSDYSATGHIYIDPKVVNP